MAADSSIREVILSGGDPLTIVDPLLIELARRIAAIPHVARLRIHTRLPIMIPERINDDLVAWLRGTRLVSLVVIHANHPAELQGAAGEAIGRLVDAGVPVLNQSVLLRGVNEDIETLAALSRAARRTAGDAVLSAPTRSGPWGGAFRGADRPRIGIDRRAAGSAAGLCRAAVCTRRSRGGAQD